MKPIIKHPGGKRKFAKRVLELLGSPPELCEPFAGGLAVSLEGSRPRIVAEAIPVIRTLYQTLASLPSALWAEIDALPEEVRSRGEFEALRARFNRNQTPGMYVTLIYACFNGLARFNKAGRFNSAIGAPLPRRIPRLSVQDREAYEEAFAGCLVLRDWREAVGAAVAAGVPIYADPPYVGTFAYGGVDGSWGLRDLGELAQALPAGSVLSERTGDPLVEELLFGAGFSLADEVQAQNVISRGERAKRVEGLWLKGESGITA